MTPIEIIALIVIVLIVIKMLVLLVKPMAWMNLAKGIYKNAIVAQVIGLILAIVVLYYLVNNGVGIVTILAVTAFVALLLMIGLATHVDDFIVKYERQIKAGIMWKENWLYVIIWIALVIWGAYEFFM